MSDHPIIFSSPMIRALLGGRKIMTRRLAWRERMHIDGVYANRPDILERVPSHWQKVRPGDRLWVRASFCPRYFDDGRDAYMADWTGRCGDVVSKPKWKPAIHMPRVASRLTLVVTATKIERLQEISESDAVAEGCFRAGWSPNTDRPASKMFCELWGELHGRGAWDANPEVVALTFPVYQKNIDTMEKPA